jgi:TPR repeat protein
VILLGVKAENEEAKVKKSKLYDRAMSEARNKAGDPAKTHRLLTRAHERGDARATYALASWYLHGKEGIVSRHPAKAVALLRAAAEDDLAEAAFDLAVSYEKGIGVRKAIRKLSFST